MKVKERLLVGICLAPFLWLTDSLFLSYFSGISFVAAFLCKNMLHRLLMRFLLIQFVLLPGFTAFIGEAWRRSEIIRMNKADDGSMFGDEEAPATDRRILYYALRLATMMKMPQRDLDKLRILCYAHDIGMIMLPVELQRRTPRTPAEQAEYYRHAEYGAHLAASIPRLSGGAELIRLHEERYDGSGPNALVGRSIPLACRIFTAVELFDRLRFADGIQVDQEQALEQLSDYCCTLLDPDVVDAFTLLLRDTHLLREVKEKVYSPLGSDI